MDKKPKTVGSPGQAGKKKKADGLAVKKAERQSWWYALGALAVVGLAVAAAIYVPDLIWARKSDQLGAKKKVERRAPKLNPSKSPGGGPDGMVWIPGGEFYMGNEELLDPDEPESYRFADSAPISLVYVNGFWMDMTEVTNEEFARFVQATGYKTVAEKQPDPRDFPNRPKEEIPKEPFSIVYKKPLPGSYDFSSPESWRAWWGEVPGACWKHPEGPHSDLKGREKHPVVHIAYDDAVAYCQWAKKRLPTEAEWEFAARGGLDRKLYPWGDELLPGGKHQCNIWQGNFPLKNTAADGFETTAPVGSFPANGYGLFDMAGNVWEWCADYYQPKYYEERAEQAEGDNVEVIRNPKGPFSGFDPFEPGVPKRVQRGGAFMCAENYCQRYKVGARGKGEMKSSSFHTGFRCAKN